MRDTPCAMALFRAEVWFSRPFAFLLPAPREAVSLDSPSANRLAAARRVTGTDALSLLSGSPNRTCLQESNQVQEAPSFQLQTGEPLEIFRRIHVIQPLQVCKFSPTLELPLGVGQRIRPGPANSL